MKIDIPTLGLLASGFMALLAVLLALTGSHVSKSWGIRYWALASLLYGAAMIVMVQPALLGHYGLLLSVVMVAIATALQLAGIQRFKTGYCNWYVFAVIVLVISVQSIVFTVVYPNLLARGVMNSLTIAVVNMICARALLVQVEPSLKKAYWLSGSLFVAYGLLHLVRVVRIVHDPASYYHNLVTLTPNLTLYFTGISLQILLVFSFVLLVNLRLSTDLQKQASQDALTGAMNRRSLEEAAAKLWAFSLRTGDPLSVIMIDVDHFKSINDRFGHQVGDEVLRRLAAVCKKSVRTFDYFARYGGEEFCILMPSTRETDALGLAERLRQAYADSPMEFEGQYLRSTISLGVADSQQVPSDFVSVLNAADQALYRAKGEGRNRVVAYSSLSIAS